MNLVAPADSFETATGVIESGADGIYLGLENQNFVNLNLSGSGRGCNLKGIAEFSHENRVLMDYIVNTSFLSDELEEMFISHVVSGYKISGGMMSVGRC